jgi:hypothetical protein
MHAAGHRQLSSLCQRSSMPCKGCSFSPFILAKGQGDLCPRMGRIDRVRCFFAINFFLTKRSFLSLKYFGIYFNKYYFSTIPDVSMTRRQWSKDGMKLRFLKLVVIYGRVVFLFLTVKDFCFHKRTNTFIDSIIQSNRTVKR